MKNEEEDKILLNKIDDLKHYYLLGAGFFLWFIWQISTLIGILGGLIIPDTGTTLVMDYNVRSEYVSARKSLGIVPQELVFDPFFTVYETLSFQLGYFGKKIDKK